MPVVETMSNWTGTHWVEIEIGVGKIIVDLIEPNKVKECLEKGLKK